MSKCQTRGICSDHKFTEFIKTGMNSPVLCYLAHTETDIERVENNEN